MKKLFDWLNAKDVSGELGANSFVSFLRISFATMIFLFLIDILIHFFV